MNGAGSPPVADRRALADLMQRLDDLAFRLLHGFPPHPPAAPPALLFTSARDGEGKTTIATAVAQAMARLCGEPVLLADANPYRPRLRLAREAASGARGLCDVLRGELTDLRWLEPLRRTGEACVLPIGTAPDPALLFQPAAVARFRALTAGYRCVVLDGGSARLGGASLAHHVDGVVMVIDSSSTRREVVEGSVREMRLAPGRMLGAVLNQREQYIPGLFYRGL